MTPAVFNGTDATDEYSLSQTPVGRAAIKKHRNTFIKESDFAWLKDNNIDAVRLPIGYWIFKSSDSLVPHVTYVDWTMKMARKYGIKVLIDLHGLKGSQNGFDHSGRIGKAHWFQNKEYREESLELLRLIAQRYKHEPQLWGLQMINEPKFGVFHFTLRRFYKRSAHLLDTILEPRTHIIFSDGFTPRLLSGALGKSRRIVMDAHFYQGVRPWTRFTSLHTYYRFLQFQKKLIRSLSKTQPIIIGEWSGSLRQQEFDKLPIAKHGALVGEHSAKQIESFQYALAWFYWSYKTEQPGVWDFRSQVDAGYIKI